jgi:hypothetical protein
MVLAEIAWEYWRSGPAPAVATVAISSIAGRTGRPDLV